MAKKSSYQIPFDKKGFLQDYVFISRDDIVWKDNFEFTSCLIYDGYGRGRSSAVIMMRDAFTQVRYPMFLSTFDDLMKSQKHTISQGDKSVRFTGPFTFCKKGQNYALKPVTE